MQGFHGRPGDRCQLNLATKASRYTPISADGSFGSATEARVRAFQQCAGLGVDGEIGSSTWAALNTWAAHPRKCATQGTPTATQSNVCDHSSARPSLQQGANGVDVKEVECSAG